MRCNYSILVFFTRFQKVLETCCPVSMSVNYSLTFLALESQVNIHLAVSNSSVPKHIVIYHQIEITPQIHRIITYVFRSSKSQWKGQVETFDWKVKHQMNPKYTNLLMSGKKIGSYTIRFNTNLLFYLFIFSVIFNVSTTTMHAFILFLFLNLILYFFATIKNNTLFTVTIAVT